MLKIHNNAKIKSADFVRRHKNSFMMIIDFIDNDDPSSDFTIDFDMYMQNEVYRMQALFLYAHAMTLPELTNKPIKFCTDDDSYVVAIGDCESNKFFLSDNRARPCTELSESDLYKYFRYKDTMNVIQERINEIEEKLDENCPRSEIKKLEEKIYVLEAARKEFAYQLLSLSPN